MEQGGHEAAEELIKSDLPDMSELYLGDVEDVLATTYPYDAASRRLVGEVLTQGGQEVEVTHWLPLE